MLKKVADGVWVAPYDQKMPLGASLPCNTAILRLEDGSLAMVSPGPLSADLATEIESLGKVEHLLAPNLFHHLHFAAARERFPEARTYGARGLDSKRSMEFDEVISDDTALPGVDVIVVEGAPKIMEALLVHRKSRTLCCSDLLFNIHSSAGMMSTVFQRLGGIHNKLAHGRIFKMMTGDRSAVGQSVARALAEPIDILVPGHGEILRDADQAVRGALAKVLSAA
jgi:hypothetical protein